MRVKANIAGGKMNWEKKIQHCKGRVTKKKLYGEKTKLTYITGV
jgi:hypothetical protein